MAKNRGKKSRPKKVAKAVAQPRSMAGEVGSIAATAAAILEGELAIGINAARKVANQIAKGPARAIGSGLGDVAGKLAEDAHQAIDLAFNVVSVAAKAIDAMAGESPVPHGGPVKAPVRKKIVILGGGVAGMSAAHELAERGYEVEVYETKKIAGGKARSFGKPKSGKRGRRDLPGEHGFRFFPGFYRHVTETMSRIPFNNPKNSVLGNLVSTPELAMATTTSRLAVAPAEFPKNWDDLEKAFETYFRKDIPPEDTLWFINRLLVFATSCDERRLQQFEGIDWWTFTRAEKRGEAFKKFYATGMTRCAVACRADLISTRTAGTILLQLLFKLATPGGQADHILNGPTNEVWIDPWLDYLKGLGVKYLTENTLVSFDCDGKKITGVKVSDKKGSVKTIVADYYIAAIPVERMKPLLSPSILSADPNLAGINKLWIDWMNGIQFYLKDDVQIAAGHVIYFDSPWALTSISQASFWPTTKLPKDYGDGTTKGILSVDISNWDTPGNLYGKAAKLCTEKEIKDEVWAQISVHKSKKGGVIFHDQRPLGDFMLDPDIVIPPGGPKPGGPFTDNLEPLLINVKNTWAFRPKAVTGIPNFFLAADYVKTCTDLATMEGANEAARLAVNGILDAENHPPDDRCMTRKLSEPEILDPAKDVDRILLALGQPNPFDMPFSTLISGGGTKFSMDVLAHVREPTVIGAFEPGIQLEHNMMSMLQTTLR